MRILRAENYRRMQWKNGGGETAEIAVFPDSAGLDDFGWRVSMATVVAGGPFSVFPEIDRTLTILDGEGMTLDIAGQAPVTLTGYSAPYSFPADAATNAELIGGPITDLNVMTRRGLHRHTVSATEINGSAEIEPRGAASLLFCRSGEMLIEACGQQERLGRFDAAVLSEPRPLRVEGRGEFFLVEFRPA